MPYCRSCGNRRLFAASSVPPVAPTANGFASGLLGDFDANGGLVTITRLGADKGTAKAAGGHPAEYFDTCLVCGSQDVEWSGSKRESGLGKRIIIHKRQREEKR